MQIPSRSCETSSPGGLNLSVPIGVSSSSHPASPSCVKSSAQGSLSRFLKVTKCVGWVGASWSSVSPFTLTLITLGVLARLSPRPGVPRDPPQRRAHVCPSSILQGTCLMKTSERMFSQRLKEGRAGPEFWLPAIQSQSHPSVAGSLVWRDGPVTSQMGGAVPSTSFPTACPSPQRHSLLFPKGVLPLT